MTRRTAVTVRAPGARMAPTNRTWAHCHVRSLKIGAKTRNTAIISLGRCSISQPFLAVGSERSLPCLFCPVYQMDKVELSPCLHVVCDQCFDSANYSACPVCEHHVDRRSPFFKPSGVRLPSPAERVTF